MKNKYEHTIFRRITSQSHSDGDCLIWTGDTSSHGHPVMSYNSKQKRVAEVMYLLYNKKTLPTLCFQRTCGNNLCISISHLYQANRRQVYDNTRNSGSYSREQTWKYGEKNPMAKLKNKEVIEIRELKYTLSKQQLAEKYGVSKWTITDIITGRGWKHII